METLKTSAQFDRVRREGRSWSTAIVVLNAARNGLDTVRCGFITGKKMGKAVRRNRARRQIREAVRLRLPDTAPGWDLVWIARPAIVEAGYDAISRAVEDLLRRGKVLTTAPAAPVETAAAQSRIIGEAGGKEDGAAVGAQCAENVTPQDNSNTDNTDNTNNTDNASGEQHTNPA